MEHKKYGLAVAYSVRARDARQVRQIADRMLHDYVELGPEQFIRSVDTIPRMLLDNAETLATEAGLTAENAQLATPFATTSSIFSTETFAPLVFHVKYRDFLELYADKSTWEEAAHILVGLLTSDVTPESFLTVLLVDALPLIQGRLLALIQLPSCTFHSRKPTSSYVWSKRWALWQSPTEPTKSLTTTFTGSSGSSASKQAHRTAPPPRGAS